MKKKRTLSVFAIVIMTALLIFSGVGCPVAVPAPAPVPVTGVTLALATATINVGATQQLTATVAPANATNRAVTWSSGNTVQ